MADPFQKHMPSQQQGGNKCQMLILAHFYFLNQYRCAKKQWLILRLVLTHRASLIFINYCDEQCIGFNINIGWFLPFFNILVIGIGPMGFTVWTNTDMLKKWLTLANTNVIANISFILNIYLTKGWTIYISIYTSIGRCLSFLKIY